MLSSWRRTAVSAALACALSSILAAACTAVPPPNTANVARVCDAQCKRLADCKPGWDVDACERNCHGDLLLPYYRDDYVSAIAQCLQTSTCDVILGSLDRSCWQTTRPTPSDIARQTCMTTVAKDHSCNGRPEEMDDCLAKWRWGALSDPVLAALADCEEIRCGNSRRNACVRATLGRSD